MGLEIKLEIIINASYFVYNSEKLKLTFQMLLKEIVFFLTEFEPLNSNSKSAFSHHVMFSSYILSNVIYTMLLLIYRNLGKGESLWRRG